MLDASDTDGTRSDGNGIGNTIVTLDSNSIESMEQKKREEN